MKSFFRKSLSIFSPLTATGGVGVCPVCVAFSASVLTWLGLAALIPIWRPIAFSLLALGIVGFILDWRKHRNFLPLALIIGGGALLYLGRYVWGGPEFSGWPIWGPGALLVVAAVFLNRRLFRPKAHAHAAKLFTCPECGMKYRDDSTSLTTGKEWAEKCETWCREHKSCNLDIIKHAVGNPTSTTRRAAS